MKVVLCALLPLLTTGVRKGQAEAETADQIASLVSTADSSFEALRDLQEQQETPGVVTALEKVKTGMKGVIKKIGTDHSATSAEVQRIVTMLDSSTTDAEAKYTTAKEANSVYNLCVSQAKSYLKQSETAFGLLEELKKNRVAPCALQESLKDFTGDFAQPDFECKISSAGNCDSQMSTWDTDFNSNLGDLGTALDEHIKKYEAAKDQCESANTAISEQNSKYLRLVSLHDTQHPKCLAHKTARDTSMCSSFGFSLQKKCTDYGIYQQRVAEIKGAGTSWSKQDRVKEFTAAKVTECLIDGFLRKVKVDSSLMSSCSAQVDYDKYFGPTEYKNQAVEDLMTSEKFNCKEEAIPFDTTWEVPAKIGGAKSEEYVEVPNWTPSYAKTGDKPFEFC